MEKTAQAPPGLVTCNALLGVIKPRIIWVYVYARKAYKGRRGMAPQLRSYLNKKVAAPGLENRD